MVTNVDVKDAADATVNVNTLPALGQALMAASLPVSLASNQSALAISAASLPLPTGAATAAKQPALGTAGSSSTDVVSVQGIASGTALVVGGNVAHDAVNAGNPSLVGGQATSAAPAAVAAGDRSQFFTDLLGSLRTIAVDGAGAVLDYTLPAPVAGAAAHDAAISGNPVRLSGRALSANYTAVSTGDTADLVTTLTGALVVKGFSIPEQDWAYAAAASGISNTTTAVTIKAAAGAGIRNYLTALQIVNNTLGAAGEIAIRDGAAGTVLWRGYLGTAAASMSFTFPSPLKGTANTLLEVVTLTASVTGAVFVNACGYTAP